VHECHWINLPRHITALLIAKIIVSTREAVTVGAHPYWYTVPYQSDLNEALQALRDREFRAGRYNPVMPFPKFPITPTSPVPGARHTTIDEAMEAADADGTRSILDIFSIGEEPDFLVAAPLTNEILNSKYGTIRPTRQMVEANLDFLEHIERGQAAYIILYEDGSPTAILFAGYSFD
jgi:hypothetical protein